jgi:hypothetical protein
MSALHPQPPVYAPRAAYLIKVEHQVQLAHIAKELIQHFHKEMYRFQVCELIVVGVYARAEEQSGIAAVDDFRGAAELDEVGLVFLVARRDEAVDLTLELDLLVVVVGAVPFG